MNWKIITIAALGLTGCQQHPPFPMASHNACGASEFGYLVGQKRATIEAMNFTQPVRIVSPNTNVTLDFQPERMNIVLNRWRKVVAITCG